MSDWFVTPDTKTLQLPGGQWVEVKKRLTVREERVAFKAVVGEVNADGWRRPNIELVGIADVAVWIVAWSLTRNGRPVPVSTEEQKIAALNDMDRVKFKHLENAIKAHAEEMDAEEKAEKNDQAGGSESVPTS